MKKRGRGYLSGEPANNELFAVLYSQKKLWAWNLAHLSMSQFALSSKIKNEEVMAIFASWYQIKRLRNSRILSLSKVGDGEKCVKQSVWDTEPFLALGWAVKGIVTALLQAGTKNSYKTLYCSNPLYVKSHYKKFQLNGLRNRSVLARTNICSWQGRTGVRGVIVKPSLEWWSYLCRHTLIRANIVRLRFA